MKKIFSTLVFALLLLNLNAQTSTWDGSATGWTKGDGTENNPYLIESAAHLAYLSQQVVIGQKQNGLYFKLMTNIDLNNIEWIPIGGRNMLGETAAIAFGGIFDGNNKTIANLKISTPDKAYTGLFGCVDNYLIKAEILNLAIISGEVNGKTSTGGIVGNFDGRIKNCSNAATVNVYSGGGITGASSFGCEIINCVNTGDVSGYSVGGMAETAYDCLIQNCHNSGSISGSYAGGIVNVVDGLIINCTNSGNISGGNIAGIARYDLSDGVFIYSCLNSGTLTGTSTTGGIGSYIDESISIIKNCYNTGTINEGGGIVGKAEDCSILNCYNVGTISSTSNSGAIVGYVYSYSIPTVTNCHYLSTCIATNNGYGSSLSSSNMKLQSFVDLLNASQDPLPWKIGNSQNNGYPILVIAPILNTFPAKNVSNLSATLYGTIESGDETIISQGFKYKKYGTSSYQDIPAFGINISSTISCTPVSGYTFMVFAETSSGTYYGEELMFTTTTAGVSAIQRVEHLAYPNPSSSVVNIPFIIKGALSSIYIFNSEGQLIERKILDRSQKEIIINVSSYTKGIYFYKYENISGKFIVN